MTLTNYKLFAIKPKAATNLVTNPSFETGVEGWTTGGTNAIAQSAAVSRRGIYACKATYTDNDLLASYAITLTDVDHVAAMDIYIPTAYTGAELTLTWTGYVSGVVVSVKPDMTFRDDWQRVSCSINPDSGDLIGALTLSETGANGAAAEFIYIDGVQIETGTTDTTYIDGDIEGNIITSNVLEYYWNGQAHASTSVRTANTRAGGELIDISAYCKNILLEGLGLAPVDNVAVPLTSGGETYLYSNYMSRFFTLQVVFEGSEIGDIQAKRKGLMNLIKPDVTAYPQPLVLRYQGYDATGKLASEPVDIKCQYVSGLDRAPQMRFAHFADITFRLSDTTLDAVGDTAAVLALNASLANADYIVKRDRDGVWSAMAGLTGTIYAIAQHPITKEIYIGGAGLNNGGDANADYLTKWNGTAWVSVVSGINASVLEITFDAAGNLYIGGNFTNLGDANGDYIVKFDGTNITSLGTGLNNYCYKIAIDSNGYIYAGGFFTEAGGVANTARIAKWDGSVWTPLSTGLNNYVNDIVIDKFNNLYIVGGFTNAGDANGDYVVKWTGSGWVSLGTGSNALLYAAVLDDNNNLYVGGHCTDLGGVTVSYWGRWNGQKWEALGLGTNNIVHKILPYKDSYFLSGVFTGAGNVSITNRIVKYLGNGIYSPLDILFPGNPVVNDIFFDNQENLYVGYSTAGTATVAGYTTITNNNAPSYPVLEFTGIGALQQINNYDTGKGIYFNGLTLLAGEVVTLDLRPDKQTITSSFRGNVKSYLVTGSNLDFPLIQGTNNIAVLMTGTDASSKGVIQYKKRLHGLDAAQYE